MKDSIVQNKSFDLAVSVHQKVTEVQKKHKDFLFSQWWAESIAAIGLNVYLAQAIHSARGFSIHLYTARKATYRSLFWTRLLHQAGSLSDEEAADCESLLTEIAKILQASLATVNAKKVKTETVATT
ncbi:MAG: four helix bundle protein [Candidatus Dojkabacteria bacterium]|nr:MAG: four helix bundle protein [Candidatus Dojkabacteria bacterium]